MVKPNLFIVGQPKSGSTALHQYLDEHPDIYMAKIKAPHFFCPDFHQESDRFHRMKLYFDYRDEDKYLSLFEPKEEKIVGESSDHYLYSEVAAQKIYQYNSKAKILIFLREPVSFLCSLHNHFVKVTNETEENFKQALALERLRIRGECVSPRIMCPSWAHYSQRIKYYEQVKRYTNLFQPSQLKVIVYEAFQQSNAMVYQDILDFLEVSSFVPRYRQVNVSKSVRFKQLNYLVNNQILKNITKNLFSQQFNDFIREKIAEKLLWKEVSKPPITLEERIKLMKKFKPEVLKISQLVGMNLEKQWGYDQV